MDMKAQRSGLRGESSRRVYYRDAGPTHITGRATPRVLGETPVRAEDAIPAEDANPPLQHLKIRVEAGHALAATEMAALRGAAEEEKTGDVLLPEWAAVRLHAASRAAPGTVADACEQRLAALRKELALLCREHPQLDWRPVALAEAAEAARLRVEGVGSAAAIEAWLPEPRHWRYMPPPRTLVKRVPPGIRPVGYRVRHRSVPAISMAAKVVLSRNIDPLLPDDNPGPGAYNTNRSFH